MSSTVLNSIPASFLNSIPQNEFPHLSFPLSPESQDTVWWPKCVLEIRINLSRHAHAHKHTQKTHTPGKECKRLLPKARVPWLYLHKTHLQGFIKLELKYGRRGIHENVNSKTRQHVCVWEKKIKRMTKCVCGFLGPLKEEEDVWSFTSNTHTHTHTHSCPLEKRLSNCWI